MADPDRSAPAPASRRPAAPPAILLSIDAATDCVDVPDLCEEVRVALERGAAGPVLCDVADVSPSDVGTIDLLARLALETRRLGLGLRLRHASPELVDLLGLAGLVEVVPCDPDSVVEVKRQSEEREPLLGVEEERDPADGAT